jgi:hypothetical protein
MRLLVPHSQPRAAKVQIWGEPVPHNNTSEFRLLGEADVIHWSRVLLTLTDAVEKVGGERSEAHVLELLKVGFLRLLAAPPQRDRYEPLEATWMALWHHAYATHAAACVSGGGRQT